MQKDITGMKKELRGVKATIKRLDAGIAKYGKGSSTGKKRELKFDIARDKSMKKDLKSDVKTRRGKEQKETSSSQST